jgi:uncharacterized protein (TIGR03084 family)
MAGADAAGDDIAADLVAEQHALDAVVSPLDDAGWATPTPSPGWSVFDQIAHLTYFDTTAALSLRDPEGFVAHRNELVAKFADPAAVEFETLGRFRSLSPTELLAEWRTHRVELAESATGVAPHARIEWYGPSMSLRSFLTARLMECWAHGQDVVDAVGADRPATDRIRHIAQLGVITRGWSYRNRGRDVPADDVRVELTAPSGAVWRWGDESAPASVTGPALDFCLVVTQRRHVDDTALVTTGDAAREWMEIAQAFAGPPTAGPAAGSASGGSA